MTFLFYKADTSLRAKHKKQQETLEKLLTCDVSLLSWSPAGCSVQLSHCREFPGLQWPG